MSKPLPSTIRKARKRRARIVTWIIGSVIGAPIGLAIGAGIWAVAIASL